ncbi:MAG: hypothetical protein ACRC2R_19940 [Xenococcaceae cyanobacterium]
MLSAPMNLDKQLQELIEESDRYGIAPVVMQQGIAPILKLFAEQLKHQEYFILQNLDQDWILTTIGNTQQPEQQKKVIYAFSTVKDAASFQGSSDVSIFAAPLSVTNILFQILAISELDSIIFLDTPGNLNAGTEIRTDRIHEIIQERLQQLDEYIQSKNDNIPNDIA